MKRLLVVTALLLAAASTSGWAQAPAAGDPHHPEQSAASAPAQAEPGKAPATAQPQMPAQGHGGGHDMMKAMQNMPEHNHDACCSVKKPEQTR